ncbi:uracil-xanthine permease family protein [Pseudomonas profundi]|uniref:uracil-xanthine permease family protein n=1 Tax=Pseudomonas profundi TaxID=1981513 RepID=UPI001238FA90|nr:solute carrier family 23 protein [Pseudomonas profundi]
MKPDESKPTGIQPVCPIYGLEDKPGHFESTLAAIQHLLAGFVNIIAPSLVIGVTLGLEDYIPMLISASLFVSGIATWIQSQKVGPLGSGLLSVQGTSFAFVAALITAGMIAREGGANDQQVLATLITAGAVGSFVEIAIAGFLPKLRRVITPVVAGTIVILIGMSLVAVALRDVGGGAGAEDFGSGSNMGLAAIVIAVVMACQLSGRPMLRVGSVFLGLLVGSVVAVFMGKFAMPDFSGAQAFAIPMPLAFGFHFDWVAFIPVGFMFIITSLETVGDITGTSRVSGEPVSGPLFNKRVRGGVLADGVNSLLAAIFTTFPNTTFSQNTGVVQLTGVASRHVGRYIAVILVVLGLIPVLGIALQGIPRPVLGATTFIMFSLIAVSGIQIVGSQNLSRAQILGVALSIGAGMGVQLVPEVLNFLPDLWQRIFGSAITTGGLLAILFGLLLPRAEENETNESEETLTEVPANELARQVN